MNTSYVYSPDPLKEGLYLKMHKLLEETPPTLYSEEVHEYLKQEHIYMVGYRKRDIILPMPTATCESEAVCNHLISAYANRQTEWPNQSHYNYGMDYCMESTAPGFMTFGYALYGDILAPCAFFTNFLMTWTIEECPGEFFPEEYVIDPMVYHLDRKPECYIGVVVPSTIVEEWLLSRREKPHPLETHVQNQYAQRLEEKNWENEILNAPQAMLENVTGGNKDLVIKWLLKS